MRNNKIFIHHLPFFQSAIVGLNRLQQPQNFNCMTHPSNLLKPFVLILAFLISFATFSQGVEYVGNKTVSSALDKSIYYTKSVTLSPGTTIVATSHPSLGETSYFITPQATSPPPSPEKNYVRQEVPTQPVSSEADLTVLDGDGKAWSYTYMDGLGRTIMTSAAEAGPMYEDVVQYVEYDPTTERQDTSYLPYSKVYTSPGTYASDAKTQTATFYNGSTANVPSDTKHFTSTTFDDRNRVETVTGVGETWHNSNKKVSYDYDVFNPTTHGNIHHWKIVSNEPQNDRYYISKELTITEVTNEEGLKTRKVTDVRGLTITNQVYDAGNSTWYGSVNVYDDRGRVRFVIPPIIISGFVGSSNSLTATQLDELVFQYEYDEYGRVKREKAPGAGWTEYVYDKWDRLILSRHEAQQWNGNNSWTFYKYDGLNRVVLSGEVESTKTRSQFQSEADASSEGRYESSSGGYEINYTINNTFPDLTWSEYINKYEVLKINQYDNYYFLVYSAWDAEGHDFSYQSPSGFTGATSSAIDLPTGSKVKILGSSTWLNTVIYYDDKLRVIQTVAENHKGGLDRISQELEWDGELQKQLVEHTSTGNSVDVLTEFVYAHNGQLLESWQTIDEPGNSGDRVLVAEYKYNAIGQVIEKNLHSTNGTSFLQSVDYDYNIRGWSNTINNVDLNDGENDVFGMQFNYTNTVSINGTNFQGRYDGLVSSMSWNSDNDPVTSGVQGGVKTINGFNYDGRNRLESMKYATGGGSWTGDAGDYDTSYEYEDNGNLRKIIRKAEGTEIDSLEMGYIANSNKLKYVDDSKTDEGFDEKTVSSGILTEYAYDAMGNMIEDDNKDIVVINYNHLQLVDKVEFYDGTEVRNTYDAVGNKLTKAVYDGDNNLIGKVDYVGLIEYVDDEVNQVFTDEGRAYRQNGEYHYEYFLMDHQQNNRVAFGNLPERHVYTATMEIEYSIGEESEFDFPSGIRTTAQNHTPLGNESVALNGTISGDEVGPAKVLTIAAGDEVEMEAWAKYTFTSWNNSSIANIASIISSTFTGASAGTGAESASSALNTALGNPGANGLFNGNTSGEPEAYLQYLFFDASYNYVQANSGYVAVDGDSQGKFDKLSSGKETFNQAGYLFVYVVNESNQNADVFFDDLQITHASGTQSFKVSQVNEYYPFGLPTSRSWRAPGYIDPGLLYQSAFTNYDSLTGNYDFLSRSYDPATGRFFAVDPAGQFSSPYAGMGNVPHMGVDPDGEIFFLGLTGLAAVLAKGAAIGAAVGAVSYSTQTAITNQSWNWGQFGKSIGMGAVGGAIAGGVGHAFGGVGSFGHELGRAAAHGVAQQGVGAAFGIDPSLGGFAAGLGGSLMGSGLQAVGANSGQMIGASALFGGAVSELSNPGSFWEGFTTAGIVAGANHATHHAIQKSQDKWLINRYKNGEKLDLSRLSKMRLNIERGARLAYLHTRGHPDLEGPMRMSDIFDFESMSKPWSGWSNRRGHSLSWWINKRIPGIDRAVFQKSVADIVDIDMTNDGRMEFIDSVGRSPGLVDYNMSTVANQSNFYMARHFMYYGWYNK